MKAILHPKTHPLFEVQDSNRLLFNKYPYRLTVRVQKAYLFSSFRRVKFHNDYSFSNVRHVIDNAIRVRRDVMAKFIFPMENREDSLTYDNINELTYLFQEVVGVKTSTTTDNLHLYFETEKSLLNLANRLRPYYKERVVGLMMPAPNVTLKPNTLLYKDPKGYKFLAVSYWSRWLASDIQMLLNITKTTNCEIGKRVRRDLEKTLTDGATSVYYDTIQIKVPDKVTVDWLKLHVGKKWKIYAIEKSK